MHLLRKQPNEPKSTDLTNMRARTQIKRLPHDLPPTAPNGRSFVCSLRLRQPGVPVPSPCSIAFKQIEQWTTKPMSAYLPPVFRGAWQHKNEAEFLTGFFRIIFRKVQPERRNNQIRKQGKSNNRKGTIAQHPRDECTCPETREHQSVRMRAIRYESFSYLMRSTKLNALVVSVSLVIDQQSG